MFTILLALADAYDEFEQDAIENQKVNIEQAFGDTLYLILESNENHLYISECEVKNHILSKISLNVKERSELLQRIKDQSLLTDVRRLYGYDLKQPIYIIETQQRILVDITQNSQMISTILSQRKNETFTVRTLVWNFIHKQFHERRLLYINNCFKEI